MTTKTTFSFVAKKDEREKLELLETTRTDEIEVDGSDAAVSFDVIKGSLTANNKFYLDFGEKAPFHFFKCFPVDPNAVLVDTNNDSETVGDDAYVHPVVWGVAKVTSSKIDTVEVGDEYMAMLPIGESVSFDQAHVDNEGNLVVHRPTTNHGYNVFRKIHPDDALASKQYGDLALASSPGIITGYGLFFNLTRNGFYGADTVVMTAASSKVSLALAVFLKVFLEEEASDDNNKKVRVVGYTSISNKDFCNKTGLYDEVLGYDEVLSTECTKCCMVDVSGQAQTYQMNTKVILKNLVVGNASGTDDKKATFSSFTTYETLKLVLTMMGAPSFITNWLNPTQELYLIMNDAAALKREWGLEKYNKTIIKYGLAFCKAAEKWITIRRCDTESSIEQAYVDIVKGTVPPSETIVLDVAKAVSSRKK
jgi:Protein of unknown function (DUF2855)